MSEYTISDPELVEKKGVDSDGRVYLGKDFKNKRVRIAVEILDEE